jgi:sortase A
MSPDRLATPGSSAGAIPAIKPFNFGRDPGGPEDKTLYLTVPKLGLTDVPVFDSVSEEKLKESVVHIPATGFPWQKGANTYIAGHRLGYEGKGSYLIFYYLDQLTEGDEIILRDAAGGTYRYRVSEQEVVGSGNVESMDTVEGKSVVSLQTCTLPNYEERLIVQGELVEKEV